jgi:hypothetical protein
MEGVKVCVGVGVREEVSVLVGVRVGVKVMEGSGVDEAVAVLVIVGAGMEEMAAAAAPVGEEVGEAAGELQELSITMMMVKRAYGSLRCIRSPQGMIVGFDVLVNPGPR